MWNSGCERKIEERLRLEAKKQWRKAQGISNSEYGIRNPCTFYLVTQNDYSYSYSSNLDIILLAEKDDGGDEGDEGDEGVDDGDDGDYEDSSDDILMIPGFPTLIVGIVCVVSLLAILKGAKRNIGK